jgi:hypothetical protein
MSDPSSGASTRVKSSIPLWRRVLASLGRRGQAERCQLSKVAEGAV